MRRPVRPLVLVAGSAAQTHAYGGHTWVFLQYLLGLRRLGYDVLFVDRLEPEMVAGVRSREDLIVSHPLRRLVAILGRFGLAGAFAVLDGSGGSLAGVSRPEVIAASRRCELLINVMGFLRDPEILGAAPRRVFLDIDPGFPQMWHALGLADMFAGHDAYATFGARVGLPGCRIPTCGLEWIATRPPVVLERWPVRPPPAAPSFATVGAWRGANAPVTYAGDTFGLRVHEFRRLSELPRRTGTRFDAALDIDSGDAADIELLRRGGWDLLDPRSATADPADYQGFIARAGAELMVAKEMYVRSRSGWFSDRSACFLASGKPVLALDTGIGSLYPTGKGLLTFDSLDGATAGAEAILGDYPGHCRAARRLAERCFDSDLVLAELLEEAMTR